MRFVENDILIIKFHDRNVSACDCDPDGSEFGGQCDRHTDPSYGLEAGRCTCKRFVDGKRCDTCKDGHWNMTKDNPFGCEGIYKTYLKHYQLVNLGMLYTLCIVKVPNTSNNLNN